LGRRRSDSERGGGKAGVIGEEGKMGKRREEWNGKE